MSNTLFLRLEGPMQSWGERAHWSERDTAPEPTKSGVVGLLACALGWRGDGEIRALSQRIHFGVRCDRPGKRMVDYHTVGGGYDEPQLLQADGKLKISSGKPHTEITWRSYLHDASFLAAVKTNSDWVEKLAKALQNPHWPIYLGRKSCVPSLPVYEGVGDYVDLRAALESRRPVRCAVPPDDGDTISIRVVLESRPGEGVLRQDEIYSRTRRIFHPRYTQDAIMTLELHPEEA